LNPADLCAGHQPDEGEIGMFRKILLAFATLIVSMGLAFADVDVNKADQAALDGVKGIGPVMSKRIIDERTKGGAYKDWNDFEKRVKGIGDKNSSKLSAAGLTVNGQAKPGAAASTESKDSKQTSKSDKAASKNKSKSDSKTDSKSDTASQSKSSGK
jgi:competence protein ComEA